MEMFENIKSQWENQSQSETPKDGAKKIMEKMTYTRKKQKITNSILTVTAAVLIAFFFYISAYKIQTVMIGLLLMIGALAIRIGLELYSLRTLKVINTSVDAYEFKQQMIRYYQNRTKVHFIITPLVIAAYCIGFVMLLPAFKSNLSLGFYNYIVVSSIVLFLILGLFIAKQIRKELVVLKELKGEVG